MNKKMLKTKPMANDASSPVKGRAGGWEVRPGGMLVQKRSIDSNQNSVVGKVKYGSSYHDISVNSQASFGELRKVVAGETGLHSKDQKSIYNDKGRDSKVFLDLASVKNGSKIVLIGDDIRKESRSLESQYDAKTEMASKEIAAIRFEVDQLAKQVAELEREISSGKKVMESVLLKLIELLMRQLIKLDGIVAEGDVKLQRRMQVKRVQNYIENLDVLKLKNSANGRGNPNVPLLLQQQHRFFVHKMSIEGQQGIFERSPRSLVVATTWETF